MSMIFDKFTGFILLLHFVYLCILAVWFNDASQKLDTKRPVRGQKYRCRGRDIMYAKCMGPIPGYGGNYFFQIFYVDGDSGTVILNEGRLLANVDSPYDIIDKYRS